ncbi:2OG-Fe(II) oxygenase [Negadavirga shengliensis]|uniref:2OG-Fe(II) oxygenase n=1 Tax=Negadavirga shengliensis TaxID=1389218 RepID=A0ABV9T3Z0_9BACT
MKIADHIIPDIAGNLHKNGHAIIPQFVSEADCDELKAGYHRQDRYRKTVYMERHRFGYGEYKYFNYPLPALIHSIRETLYPFLVPVANLWMKVLHTGRRFPDTHKELLEQCIAHGQHKPTPLILKYGPGGYNTLHQDLYGEIYFPMQAVLFLSDPVNDHAGGEFVLTEQVPRAQTKATVLKPRKGDILVFTTHFRPAKGKNAYYRINVKHGVSEVVQGERYTLGIIFHDALN